MNLYYKHRNIIYLFLIFISFNLIFYFLGCFSIKIADSPLVTSESDFLIPGGNNFRNNISTSKNILSDPLKEIWSYDSDAGYPKYPVTISDDIVFLATLDGKIHGLNIKNGVKVGSISVKAKSLSSAPVINGNSLLYATNGAEDNYIYKYDLIKGQETWQIPINRSETAPLFVRNKFITSTVQGEVICVDSDNGKILWNSSKTNSDEKFEAFYSSPASSGNLIFIGNDNGILYSINVNTGLINRKIKTESKIISDVSIYNNYVFFGTSKGDLYCTDTSLNIIWSLQTGYKFMTSFTFMNNIVIAPAVEGIILMINIKTGLSVKEIPLSGALISPPLLNDGKIYIGCFDNFFYCIDAHNGNFTSRTKFEGRIRSSAVIWNNYLFITCDDKKIYCFK